MDNVKLILVHLVKVLLLYSIPPVHSKTQNEIVDQLFSHYDRRERPSLRGEPTIVALDMFVNTINNINEISMEYSISVFLRQTWRDHRLAIHNQSLYNETLSLNQEYISKMWQPDVVVKNEISKGDFHEITVPNILLSLSPNGTILYSQRISTKLSCFMMLHRFPFDKQTCSIDFESYGYTDRDLTFQWKNIENPVQLNDNMRLPDFNITGYHTENHTITYVTGDFSSLRAVFKVERLYQFYLVQVYVPSVLIVLLSWISFWVDLNSVPARTSIGLLTVLTITTQTNGVVGSLPKVSYVKALDIWMFTCTVFVVAGFLEYALVNVLARRFKYCRTKYSVPKERGDIQHTNGSDATATNCMVCVTSETTISYSCTSCGFKGKMTTNKPKNKEIGNRATLVDFSSRILFPALFVVFNVGYWTYLYRSGSS